MQQNQNVKQFRTFKCTKPVKIRMPEYKEEIKEPIKVYLRQFNYGSHSVKDLNSINWEQTVAIQLSESGAQGVIFVETQMGTVTLKYSGQVGVDIFLNKLARKIGVPVPQMKYINWRDQEMKIMTSNLTEASRCDDVLCYRMKEKFKVAFFELIEYIPNLSISKLGPLRAPLVFSAADIKGKLRLVKIGFIYAFDIFLNNGDRCPLNIWRNEGNIENLLLKVQCFENNLTSEKLKSHDYVELKYEDFYAIDHTMILQPQSGNKIQEQIIEKYKQTVRENLQKILEDLTNYLEKNEEPKHEVFHQLMTLIYNYTLFQMKKIDTVNIMLGICIGIYNLVQLGIDGILKIKDETLIDEEEDWEGNFNKDLNRFNLEFSQQILEVFSEVLSQFKTGVIKALELYNQLQNEEEKI